MALSLAALGLTVVWLALTRLVAAYGPRGLRALRWPRACLVARWQIHLSVETSRGIDFKACHGYWLELDGLMSSWLVLEPSLVPTFALNPVLVRDARLDFFFF